MGLHQCEDCGHADYWICGECQTVQMAEWDESARITTLRAENAELREKVKVADGLKRIVDEENLVLCKNNGNQSTSLGSLLAETEKQEKELRTLRAAIDAAKEKE